MQEKDVLKSKGCQLKGNRKKKKRKRKKKFWADRID
jgi:hypothetical protein